MSSPGKIQTGKGPVSDNAGAQERGETFGRDPLRKGVDERGVSDQGFRVPARLVVPGEPGRNTQVFGSFPAIPASAAGAVEPGHTDPLSRGEPRNPGTGHIDPSHDFVSRNNAGNAFRKIPLHDVKIGPAHPAGLHPHQYLAGSG
jgi:hypothetical protein